jgi:zonular occludens toxin Zot
VPVTGFVGLPGSGKTLRLVQLGLEARSAGRDVYANFRLGSRVDGYIVPTCLGDRAVACLGSIHDFAWHHPDGYEFRARTPELDRSAERYGLRRGKGFVPDPNAYLLTSWEQVVAIRVARDVFGTAHRLSLQLDGVKETKDGPEEIWTARPVCAVWNCEGCSKGVTVLLDELNLWAPSRFWERLGIGVLNRWAYVRKDGLAILWSAQHEARIDKVAREVTEFMWSCRSLGGAFRLFGRWPIHLQVFHRRKWIPALMTDKNRVSEGEGAKAHGAFGLDLEIAFWWSLARAAESYDTYEHVADEGAGAKAADGGRAPLQLLAGQASAGSAGAAAVGEGRRLTRGVTSGPPSPLVRRQADLTGTRGRR